MRAVVSARSAKMPGPLEGHGITPRATARLLRRLRDGNRRTKLMALAGTDALLLMLAAWSAFSLRLGEMFEPSARVIAMMGGASLVSVLVFRQLGLYRPLLRFIGAATIWRLVQGMAVSALVWIVLGFVTQFAGDENVPRSMPPLFGIIGLTLLTGARFGARWLLWRSPPSTEPTRRVLIYGAGSAGRQLAISLRAGGEVAPVGFIDDDRSLAGREIDGLRVHASEDLDELAELLEAEEVIVTTASAPALRRSEILGRIERGSLRVRILPPLADIASGRHVVSLVRELDIDDLLGREPVAPAPDLLAACVTGRVVLVTGAGGSIGSEICRQVVALQPRRLLVLDASEHALYEIDRRLAEIGVCEVVPVLGSVEDEPMVERVLRAHQVQTVYHAAAHKHVPLVERNPLEGVANNVFGTLSVARSAYRTGVDTFVLISSDKAVRPTSVMGATKRWAELIVQDLCTQARMEGVDLRFCAVRFGNVLGSSGSVVPLFKEQISRGGPVTVTHPDVTRYFMSVHEAVALVLQAGSLARGGEVFLIDMGEPVRIVDLARRMIALAGYTVRESTRPDGDIEIRYSGLRPAEKLHEELLITDRRSAPTVHPKIMKGDEPDVASFGLRSRLDELRAHMEARNEQALARLLLEVANWQGGADASSEVPSAMQAPTHSL